MLDQSASDIVKGGCIQRDYNTTRVCGIRYTK